MKRVLFVGAGSALLIAMGGVGSAMADNANSPHLSTAGVAGTTYPVASAGAGRCASCHRAHTAKAALLLKAAQPDLCYSCHGTAAPGSSTDVENGQNANSGAALRGGGFKFALIGAGEATKTLGAIPVPDPITGVTPRQSHSATVPALGVAEASTSKHQIDGVTPGTMWGNGAISATANPGQAAVTLECGSCHDPHGNGNYRILRPVPNDSAMPKLADPVTGLLTVTNPGVTVPDAPLSAARVYTTLDYWSVTDRSVPAVKGGALPLAVTVTDGYIANASQWCSTCHTRYLAKSPAYETDSGDAIFTYRHTSGRTDKAGVERPNCIQCHVSHGSNAAMGTAASKVPFPGADVDSKGDAVTLSSDSKLLRMDNRGVCVACHDF